MVLSNYFIIHLTLTRTMNFILIISIFLLLAITCRNSESKLDTVIKWEESAAFIPNRSDAKVVTMCVKCNRRRKEHSQEFDVFFFFPKKYAHIGRYLHVWMSCDDEEEDDSFLFINLHKQPPSLVQKPNED